MKLRHRFGLCKGFEPYMVQGVPMLRAHCVHCVKKFDLIKAEWCGALSE
jgi:hypothetical protein